MYTVQTANERIMASLLQVCILCTLLIAVQCTVDEAPTVEINTGKLVGSVAKFTHNDVEHTVHTYKGIPFAEPPVGDLRFRKPVPKSPWDGVYDATYHRKACMQTDVAIIPYLVGPKDEDCLHLTVYVPQPTPKKAAVMVWIHGGGMLYGTSSLVLYEASPLAGLNDVIVVAINYRLGILGLLSTGDSVATGNYALHDQILALKWVNENIEAFGGDKDRITIFGESAGGLSSHFLILSPLATGLFQRAIMLSGNAVMDGSVEDSVERMNMKARGLGKAVGCEQDTNEELMECLRNLPAEDFMEPQDPMKGVIAKMTGLPPELSYFISTLDGEVLTAHPETLVAEETYNKVDTLLGSNSDEGTLFLLMFYAAQGNQSEIMVEKATFDALVQGFVMKPAGNYPSIIDTAKLLYTDWSVADSPDANYFDAFSQIIGDQLFVCPTDKVARSHSKVGLNTYLYHYTHIPSKSLYPAKFMKAAHGEELQLLFAGHLIGQVRPGEHEQIDNWTTTDEEIELSSQIMKYFTNFAKTGNPNLNDDGSATDVEWPKYTIPELQYMDLSPSLPVKKAVKSRECAFWNELVPTLMKQIDAEKSAACGSKGETGEGETAETGEGETAEQENGQEGATEEEPSREEL